MTLKTRHITPHTHLSRFVFSLVVLSTMESCTVSAEGTSPGDCTDRADNDGDGLFDCDDDGCAGSPDCTERDTDTADTIVDDTGLDNADDDGDGYSEAEGDCDDHNSAINPSATDVVGDGIDQNCDDIDGTDADGDGYAASWSGGDDCDDDSAVALFTFPGAAPYESPMACMKDYDGDDFGDELPTHTAVIAGTDCDDSDAGTNPAASETIGDDVDYDCDGYLNVVKGLSEADAKLLGQNGDWVGFSLSSVGDVNGDGHDDLLIGAIGADDRGWATGAAYLVYGPVLGDIDLSTSGVRFVGEDEGDFAGWSVSSAGDVDADGYGDLLIGAYQDDDGGVDSGAVYVVRGPVLSDFELSNADGKLIGENADDDAGYCVALAGDVDEDGHADLLVGAPWNDSGGSDAGTAYLVLGPVSGIVDFSAASGKLVGEKANSHAGTSVSSAGDFDADGHADLLVGAPNAGFGPGAVYLLCGPISGEIDLSSSDGRLVGDDTFDGIGSSVSLAGDVNSDGHDDVLIGAHQNGDGGSNAGAAYLIYGGGLPNFDLSSAAGKYIGEEPYDYAGTSVSSAGDVDGDGFDDMLVAAIGNDTGGEGAGATYLLFGPADGNLDLSSAGAKFVGEDWDAVGMSWFQVSSAGDMDGDGNSDLLIGDPYYGGEGASAGAAHLLLSASLM